ncbi:MAG: Pyrimidine deaminase archaeal predicted [Nitrosopumilales archaeon]|nr:MAG: Pyrimidine deaminase archaeal predicted [Nitrosopumilales archaeon]
MLRFYSRTQKLRAIHAAETKGSVNVSKRMTRKSEVIRALQLKPHFLVHMTQASKSELLLASKKTRGIVICPRANASLAEGIPNLQMMLQTRCNIAIGTDNVMINSPDMFREMDYLWKVSMATSKKRIDPKQILKMATVNAGKLLQKGIGTIERGKLADCVLINKHSIDLEPMLSPHASIVHRASENAIRAVIIGGKIVHGKI